VCPLARFVREELVELGLMTERLGPGGWATERQHAFPIQGHTPFVGLGAVDEVYFVRRGLGIHGRTVCNRCACEYGDRAGNVVDRYGPALSTSS
jgi:hypothetical protein